MAPRTCERRTGLASIYQAAALSGALVAGVAAGSSRVWGAPIAMSSRVSAAPLSTTVRTNAAKTGVAKSTATATSVIAVPLTQEQKIVHVLNRLAFGPRPGDVEAVRRVGISRWIDSQLDPSAIDDSDVERKLSSFRTLNYPVSQLMLAYEGDQLMTRQRREARLQRLAEAKGETYMAKRPELNARQQQSLDAARAQGFDAGISMQVVGEMQSAKILRALESKRQLQEVMTDFWSNHFNLDVKKQAVRTLRLADERDVIRPNVFGKFRALLGASAHSPAMLIYLDNARSTVEYSMGGQNAKNGLNRQQQQRRAAARAARRKAMGLNNVNDTTLNDTPQMTTQVSPQIVLPLGSASANTASVNTAPANNVVAPRTTPSAPKTRGGINENYARELMELHTLGVGGGYTQKDVQEVARCFTGWSIDRQTGDFRFFPGRHDKGEKTVLGHVIPAGGGESDGERVLDILAAHPSTAHFLARKMCRRLVSDTPSDALVERVAQVFLKTGGDLKQVTKAIVTSPEFLAPQNYRTKIKSPFEYSISAARALDATFVMPDFTDNQDRMTLVGNGAASARPNAGQGAKGGRYAQGAAKTLTRQIALMGEPLYSFQAPTGYSENSQDWVSSGALIARLNFALDLTNGRIPDVDISREALFHGLSVDDKAAWLSRLEDLTLHGDISASTQKTMQSQIKTGAPFDAAKMCALLLGSPEFQRR